MAKLNYRQDYLDLGGVFKGLSVTEKKIEDREARRLKVLERIASSLERISKTLEAIAEK